MAIKEVANIGLSMGIKIQNFSILKLTKGMREIILNNIKDETGKKNEDETQSTEVIAAHFEKLSTEYVESNAGMVFQLIKSSVSTAMANLLSDMFTGDEVAEALAQMHPTKASGTNGMSALFYQISWSLIGSDVIDKFLGILNRGETISSINYTYLSLILKKKVCKSPTNLDQ